MYMEIHTNNIIWQKIQLDNAWNSRRNIIYSTNNNISAWILYTFINSVDCAQIIFYSQLIDLNTWIYYSNGELCFKTDK